MFWKVLGYFVLVDVLPALLLLPLDLLDPLALDVAGADQHALQGAETEIIMALRRQLLVTEPEDKNRA